MHLKESIGDHLTMLLFIFYILLHSLIHTTNPWLPPVVAIVMNIDQTFVMKIYFQLFLLPA